jgi:hypothetical protein
MLRLFFLTPNLTICKAIVEELERNGVPERHLHVVASIEQRLEGLPEASILQKSELLHGLKKGGALGGTAGILGGLLAMAFPPAGLVIGGGALLTGAVAGAGFGAVVSALMSSHEHSHDLESYEQAVEAGQVLLLVDVPKPAVERTRDAIMRHHPKAKIVESRLKSGI